MPDFITPMQLKNYDVEEISLLSNLNFDPESAHPAREVEIDFDIHHFGTEEGRKDFRIRMTINVNKKKSDFETGQYKIRFIIQSVFQFYSDVKDSEEFDRFLIPNGLAMTYSISRGIIGQLTGTGLNGSFFLPTVNMHRAIDKKIRELDRLERKWQRQKKLAEKQK